jgi:hypothetical protein
MILVLFVILSLAQEMEVDPIFQTSLNGFWNIIQDDEFFL